MKTSALIANGTLEGPPSFFRAIERHERIVAVDGGLAHCHRLGLNPQLLVGDFDSTPPDLLKQYAQVPRMILPRDKDVTDLEAAIQHEFTQGSDKIFLYGAWGGRIDHSLTNALLLGRHPGKLQIETPTETVLALSGYNELSCSAGQTLSLIPLFGKAKGITSVGLKWELVDRQFDYNFIGISNVCLKTPASLSIREGTLLFCKVN